MDTRALNSGATLRWLLQAGLGIALLILLAIHLVVNHWAAPQGLLTYADVIRYYDVAGIAWMELLFLIVVTGHCLLGLQSIVLDLNLRPETTRILTRLLLLAGVITIMYGVWLIRIIVSLSVT